MVALTLARADGSSVKSPRSATTAAKATGTTQYQYSKYYDRSDWPLDNNPFHEGEVKLQNEANVHHLVMQYAPRVVRPYMPDQHRKFYTAQPFMVAAARDMDGNMWSTLIMNHDNHKNKAVTTEKDWLTSPDPQTLVFHYGSSPVTPGDALYGALREGSDLGLLGIEFATKRRNRVNGRITKSTFFSDDDRSFVFSTDQSFGNCPQYIQPRRWWTTTTTKTSTLVSSQGERNPRKEAYPSMLTNDQMRTIHQAETIFTATGYRGEGNDVRFGNDASHRGGPKGFVMVKDERTLLLPEFAGNNHFNTLGNLQMDNRMGITVPFFEDGGMLQMSGWAEVNMDTDLAAVKFPGAHRLIIFHILHVNEVPRGSLPIRWSHLSESDHRQLLVASIVRESENVKSFHLQPLPQDVQSLWDFKPGQHLPIQLPMQGGGELLRTYSLSGPPGSNEYRISVKHEPFGKASTILHHNIQAGDIIHVSKPAGEFYLDKESTQPVLVLISSGIGVTPMLPMLYAFVDGQSSASQLIWIHGARNGNFHPFQGEVKGLQQQLLERVGDGKKKVMTTHIRYSQPLSTDTMHDSIGRIDLKLLQDLIDLQKLEADFYICGNGSFLADVQGMLEQAGVDSRHIRAETF
eukprot:scaffold40377_cov168-Amphora_coffeaeformis.AAC.8